MAGLLIKELKIRGLVQRILIVTPANLSFQWQRELKDKFQEKFEVIRSDVLRANYGSNPWQERNQVVTSISWVSRVEDAKEMVKQQQMRWTQQGAHLLLQIRAQALNGDLRGAFCRWYPGMERHSGTQNAVTAAA